jgi:hypothetical protein
MSEFAEKIRTIGAPRGRSTVRKVVERDRSATIITTEHSDGRQDVAVRPDTVRYEAVSHRTGSKKGQVAEIREKGKA